jgi:hypothetical protein
MSAYEGPGTYQMGRCTCGQIVRARIIEVWEISCPDVERTITCCSLECMSQVMAMLEALANGARRQ